MRDPFDETAIGRLEKIQERAEATYEHQLNQALAATGELWKHLMVLEATVLGLTVGLLGATAGRPSVWLLWSWVALLVALVLGGVLAKLSIEARGHLDERSYHEAVDAVAIVKRAVEGTLSPESDEYQGLVLAAELKSRGEPLTTWSPEQRARAKHYLPELPSRVLEGESAGRLKRWLFGFVEPMEMGFYITSLAAATLLLMSVLLGP